MQIEAKYPREAIKKGFQYEIIDNGEIWIDMLEKRNLMSHTYDAVVAQTALQLITQQYFLQLNKFYNFFNGKIDE